MTLLQEVETVTETLKQLYEGYSIRHSEMVCDVKDAKFVKLKCTDKNWRYVRKYTDVDKNVIYWTF